eukprot:PhF_6_TR4230/c0_g1_i1/m.5720
MGASCCKPDEADIRTGQPATDPYATPARTQGVVLPPAKDTNSHIKRLPAGEAPVENLIVPAIDEVPENKYWRCPVCSKTNTINPNDPAMGCRVCGADVPALQRRQSHQREEDKLCHRCGCDLSSIVSTEECPYIVSNMLTVKSHWKVGVLCARHPNCFFLIPPTPECLCRRLIPAEYVGLPLKSAVNTIRMTR